MSPFYIGLALGFTLAPFVIAVGLGLFALFWGAWRRS